MNIWKAIGMPSGRADDRGEKLELGDAGARLQESGSGGMTPGPREAA